MLGKETVMQYFVAGPPQVSKVLPPQEYANVTPDRDITIIFDRPMVALTTISERANQLKGWNVSIEPKVDGTWKWISTTTAEFTPSKGLKAATKYRVNVPAGIETLNGEKTEQDYGWDFSTALARVLNTEMRYGFDRMPSTLDYTMHFNQEVDLNSVEQHAKLFDLTKNEPPKAEEIKSVIGTSVSPDLAQLIPVKAKYGIIEEDGTKKTDKSTVVLTASTPLAWDSWHTVVIEAGVQRSVEQKAAQSHLFRTSRLQVLCKRNLFVRNTIH